MCVRWRSFPHHARSSPFPHGLIHKLRKDDEARVGDKWLEGPDKPPTVPFGHSFLIPSTSWNLQSQTKEGNEVVGRTSISESTRWTKEKRS